MRFFSIFSHFIRNILIVEKEKARSVTGSENERNWRHTDLGREDGGTVGAANVGDSVVPACVDWAMVFRLPHSGGLHRHGVCRKLRRLEQESVRFRYEPGRGPESLIERS
jgi:hypothetical protein